MADSYEVGQLVYIKLPKYKNRKRGILTYCDQKADIYKVVLNINGAQYQVSRHQISDLAAKPTRQSDSNNSASMSNFYLQSVSTQLSPQKSVTTVSTTPTAAEKSKNDGRHMGTDYRVGHDSGATTGESTVSSDFFLIELMVYVSLITFCVFVIRGSFLSQSIIYDFYRFADGLYEYLANHQRTTFFASCFFLFNLLSFCLLRTIDKRRILSDVEIPVLCAIFLYLSSRFMHFDFSFAFTDVGHFSTVYGVFTLCCFIVSSRLTKQDRVKTEHIQVFFHQHSVLLMIFLLFYLSSQKDFGCDPHLRLLKLFYVGETVVAAVRLYQKNFPLRVNCFDILFARPFLLCVPLVQCLRMVSTCWHTVLYVLVGILYTFCFVMQLWINLPVRRNDFRSNFYSSVCKMCMALLTGFYFFSFPAWISVFLHLFIESVL